MYPVLLGFGLNWIEDYPLTNYFELLLKVKLCSILLRPIVLYISA